MEAAKAFGQLLTRQAAFNKEDEAVIEIESKINEERTYFSNLDLITVANSKQLEAVANLQQFNGSLLVNRAVGEENIQAFKAAHPDVQVQVPE